MQGDPAIIEMLNEILTAELTAINQYFIHAKMCSNWGFTKLADHVRDESIDEMKHAEALIDRILYLDG
ncbi:MAG: bacterioferritin, partial [Acidimicrobiales bacterium]|nr:bacterioferritin [Acidimicrobiales bacterium]